MKTCKQCGTLFDSRECGACKKRRDAAYYKANFDRIKEQKKKYNASRAEHFKKVKAEYYEKNKEKTRLDQAAYRAAKPWVAQGTQARYRQKNAHYYAERCRHRQATKLKATPAWVNSKAIEALYAEARKLKADTGVDWHIDHIIPLRSDIVCGLHWEANLRLVTQKENQSKGNRHWPDMP